MDIKERMKQEGYLVLSGRGNDTDLVCVCQFSVCVPSDKVPYPLHEGRKCYYELTITHQKPNQYLDEKTLKWLRIQTTLRLPLNKPIKPAMWYKKHLRWSNESSRLEVLTIVGKSIDELLLEILVEKASKYRANANNNNQYEISGVVQGQTNGICEHCGSKVKVEWEQEYDGPGYSRGVGLFCENGCWIWMENVKKMYMDFYNKTESRN